MTGSSDGTLEVLVVDDEEPALEDLAYLLRQHPRIGSVVTASDATEALRRLRDGSFAAVVDFATKSFTTAKSSASACCTRCAGTFRYAPP